MFGEYFYNQTIYRTTAVFGTLFNNIYVGRKDGTGKLVNQKRVPLAVGPRQKFLTRIEERDDLTKTKVAIQLPRMSFEYGAPVYDPERQRNKRSYLREEGKKIKNPAPYRIPFTLSIMTKNEDEGVQILEQILPYFQPSIGVKLKPVKGEEIIDDTIFTLQQIHKEDTYDATFTERRTLIWTLTFDASVNFYRDISATANSNVQIKTVNINSLGETDDVFETLTLTLDPTNATEDSEYEIVCQIT